MQGSGTGRRTAQPSDSIYVEETSRTLISRYRNYLRDYRRVPLTQNLEPGMDGSSGMMDHSLEKHGSPDDFLTDLSFKPVSIYRDPLTRQIEELVRIAWAVERGVHYNSEGKEVSVRCLNV